MKNKQKIIPLLILLIFSLIWLTPILYMFFTSFKLESEAIKWPIKLLPESFSFHSYDKIFNDPQAPVLRWFTNSLFIATTHTILAVLVFSMAGYAFAKVKFKGRDLLFRIILMSMMIPGIMNLVPMYLIASNLKMVDTPWAMILPGLSGVFNVFLLRQFFRGISDELIEAAILDGANQRTIFFKIMLPLVKPALIVVAMNSFLSNWNDFLWPSIVTSDISQRTLPIGLQIIKGSYGGRFSLQLALVVISIIPTLVLFIALQKNLVKGTSIADGVKG